MSDNRARVLRILNNPPRVKVPPVAWMSPNQFLAHLKEDLKRIQLGRGG